MSFMTHFNEYISVQSDIKVEGLLSKSSFEDSRLLTLQAVQWDQDIAGFLWVYVSGGGVWMSGFRCWGQPAPPATDVPLLQHTSVTWTAWNTPLRMYDFIEIFMLFYKCKATKTALLMGYDRPELACVVKQDDNVPLMAKLKTLGNQVICCVVRRKLESF